MRLSFRVRLGFHSSHTWWKHKSCEGPPHLTHLLAFSTTSYHLAFPCLRTCSYCIHVRSHFILTAALRKVPYDTQFSDLEHWCQGPTPEAKSPSPGSLPESGLCSSGCPFLILTTSFVLAHSKTVQPSHSTDGDRGIQLPSGLPSQVQDRSSGCLTVRPTFATL